MDADSAMFSGRNTMLIGNSTAGPNRSFQDSNKTSKKCKASGKNNSSSSSSSSSSSKSSSSNNSLTSVTSDSRNNSSSSSTSSSICDSIDSNSSRNSASVLDSTSSISGTSDEESTRSNQDPIYFIQHIKDYEKKKAEYIAGRLKYDLCDVHGFYVNACELAMPCNCTK